MYATIVIATLNKILVDFFIFLIILRFTNLELMERIEYIFVLMFFFVVIQCFFNGFNSCLNLMPDNSRDAFRSFFDGFVV